MTNPEETLKQYLRTLVENFVYLNSILDQVNEFYSWFTENGDQAIRTGGWFYKVSLFSFKRILTIETCKFLLDREERSLIDWLNKAKEHANSLNPTEYRREGFEHKLVPLTVEEYQSIIDEQIEALSNHDDLKNDLKSLRDKGFAHADKEYFENPDKLETDFLITWDDFNMIFKLISEILRRHHVLILNADVNLHLSAAGTIENILKHTRAFQRIWSNKKLNDIKLKKYAFKLDEGKYDPDDIFLS
ncbi:hypothetical protein ACG2F4_05055 [Halalkalibaculum sp. DA3122]|uniref:AbiU2 domain-containing protein n=1 Tax=Halalkalibaculum sp. DA3122 TaxID=3373607 RepID=UPI0037545CEE